MRSTAKAQRCRWLLVNIAFLFSLLPAVVVAAGTPPMITDDPGTPGPGRWEIDLGWAEEQRRSERDSRRPVVQLAYGVSDHFQLKYETALIAHRSAGHDWQSELGNSIVGVKWQLRNQESHGLYLSVHPQLEFRRPGSSAVRSGLIDDENFLVLPVQFQRDFESWSVFADLGRIEPSRSPGEWFGGIAVSRDFGTWLTLAGEITVSLTDSFDRSVTTANLGAHVVVTQHLAVMLSCGRELQNRDAPKAGLLTYLGVQLQL